MRRCGSLSQRLASAAVARACSSNAEVFADGRVLVLPAGIGMAPPLERHGAYVHDARCSYAARTTGPTGLVEVSPFTVLLVDRANG